MSKNKQLQDAIRSQSLGNTKAHIAALDAILAAGNSASATAVPMRGAVLAHAGTWSSLGVTDLDTAKDDSHFINEKDSPKVDSIYQDAGRKRVELGLDKLTNTELAKIIAAPGGLALRKELSNYEIKLGLDKVAGGFKPADVNVIDDGAVPAIQLAATKIVLTREINACDKSADIAAIEDLLTPGTKVFKTISIDTRNIDPTLRNTVIKKAFELNMQHQPSIFISKLAAKTNFPVDELRKDNASFSEGFANTSIYKDQLKGDKAEWAKALLARAYLKEVLENCTDVDKLVKIAAATDAASLTPALAELTDPADAEKFVKYATKDKKFISDMREIAFKKALIAKINACTDPKTLKDLAEAEDLINMRVLLKNSKQLGFDGHNSKACDNLSESLFREAVGVAHVRNLLEQGDKHVLKDIISNNMYAPATTAAATATPTPPTPLQDGLATYRTAGNVNQKKAREDALVKLVQISALTATDLKTIADQPDALSLNNTIKTLLLGGDNSADNLFTPPDDNFNKRLKTTARVEQWVKTAKSKPFNEIQLLIQHDFGKNNAGGFDDKKNLIKALISPTPSTPASQKARADLAERITSIAIDKWPDADKAGLQALANIKDLVDFKKALVMKFAGSFEWVDEASQKRLQQRAYKKIFTWIAPTSVFKRDSLTDLLTQLPVEKQQIMIEHPEILTKSLMQSHDGNEVRLIIEEGSMHAERLAAENKKRAWLSQIQNAKVAELLDQIIPPLKLENSLDEDGKIVTVAQKIATLNAALGNVNDFSKAKRFSEFVSKHIKPLFPNADITIKATIDTAIDAKFGINPLNPKKPVNDLVRADVEAQCNCNQHILAAVTLAKNGWLLKPLLAIGNKTAPMTPTEASTLLGHLKTQKNKIKDSKSLIAAIKAHTGAVPNGFPPDWEKYLTEETFKPIEIGKKKAAVKSNDDLAEMKSATDEMMNTFNRMEKEDDAYHAELRALRGEHLDLENYLEKKYGGHARQTARQLLPYYEKIGRDCDERVVWLLHVKKTLEDNLAALPDSVTAPTSKLKKAKSAIFGPTVDSYRKELEKNIKRVDEGIRVYSQAANAINGDDTKKGKGILPKLKRAAESYGNYKFTDMNYNMETYTTPERKAELLKNHKVDGESSSATKGKRTSASYGGPTFEASITEIGKGDGVAYSVHPVGTKTEDPNLLLQENLGETSWVEKGKTLVAPKIHMLAAKFPEDEVNRIAYAKLAAAKLLEQLPFPPSEEHPIRIRGNNPKEVGYLWAALLKAGEEIPGMKFGSKAIAVDCYGFNPKDHLGFFGGLKKSSEYYGLFTTSAGVKGLAEEKVVEQTKLKGELQTARNFAAGLDKTNKITKKLTEKNTEEESARPTIHKFTPGSS